MRSVGHGYYVSFIGGNSMNMPKRDQDDLVKTVKDTNNKLNWLIRILIFLALSSGGTLGSIKVSQLLKLI